MARCSRAWVSRSSRQLASMNSSPAITSNQKMVRQGATCSTRLPARGASTGASPLMSIIVEETREASMGS